jgi:UDPglucose--hexose-1-phosphate uridylyltransferase
LEEWVVIAPHRQDRTFLPSSDQCPLCPSTPAYATEIPAGHYDVVVFENRFPSFASSSAEGASPAAFINDIAPEEAARRLREGGS